MIDRVRHARQLSLPEIGERGQLALGASRIRLQGDARAVEAAREYLERAGCPIANDGALLRVASSGEVARIAGSPELEEAAAWIAGCVSAAAHVARTVGACTDAAPNVPTLTGPSR